MKRELLMGVSAVAIGFTLAAGLESEEVSCDNWRLTRNLFVCESEDGVVVENERSGSHLLPPDVTSKWQVYSFKDKVYWTKYLEGEISYLDQWAIYEVDMNTGESVLRHTYCNYGGY